MIIDGNALLHRAWHALPQTMKAPSGVITNAAYGFTAILLKAIREIKPSYVVVCFDSKGKTFRDKLYKEYKAHRKKKPQELYDQIPIIQEALLGLNIPYVQKTGIEADDLIGTLAKKAKSKGGLKSVIVTGDMDTLQLVDEDTEVYTLKKGITETTVYGVKEVKDRYDGLTPEQLVDFKALRGDPSDNIPGARGIGEKTALELMKKFGSVDALYKRLKEEGESAMAEKSGIKASVFEKVRESKDAVTLSKKLVQIDYSLKLKFSFEKASFPDFKTDRVLAVFQKYAFRSLFSSIQQIADCYHIEREPIQKTKNPYVHITEEAEAKRLAQEFSKQAVIAVDTETDSLDAISARLLGVSASCGEKTSYYIDASCIKPFIQILENAKIKKVGHNIKFDIASLKNAGVIMKGVYFDTMIAAYVLNPGVRQYGLDSLVFEHFGVRMQKIEELIGERGRQQLLMSDVDPEKVARYSAEDAYYTWRLYEKFQKDIEKKSAKKVFYEIEMPLVPILEEMERAGVLIDRNVLDGLHKEVSSRLIRTEQKIYSLVGSVFNINSPQQLKEILFEKLKIQTKGIRKVKTGVSTAASELEKLRGAHPVVGHLFEYRELAKLDSTYIKTLPLLVDAKTGRIHTSFNQVIAATGRLSSSDPNVQNIPIKSDIGREIRRAFVAASGYRLLSLDYSQVELRIAAHLSGDEHLIQSFLDDKDIHTATAARIFGKCEEEITRDERRHAKEANFGVLYGLGVRGLSERLGVPLSEAQDFIARYRSFYPKVFLFLEAALLEARRHGYAATLYGRRRYLPDIRSGSPVLRATAERAAINMPVQGTAADIMKMAMIKIEARIKRQELKDDVKMLLQVHDELVFEVREDVVEKWVKVIKEEMEGAAKLKVPLKVEAKAGKNWKEMEDMYV